MCCQADVDMYVMCRYLDIKINDFVLSINIYSVVLIWSSEAVQFGCHISERVKKTSDVIIFRSELENALLLIKVMT